MLVILVLVGFRLIQTLFMGVCVFFCVRVLKKGNYMMMSQELVLGLSNVKTDDSSVLLPVYGNLKDLGGVQII